MSRILDSYRKAEQARVRKLASASRDASAVDQRAEQRPIGATVAEAAKVERTRPYENIVVLAAQSAEPVRRKKHEPGDAPRSNFAALTTIGRHGEAGGFERMPLPEKSRSRRAFRWLVALLLISIAAAAGYFAYVSLPLASPPVDSDEIRVNDDTVSGLRQPEAVPAMSPPRIEDAVVAPLVTSPRSGASPENSEDDAVAARQDAPIVEASRKTATPAALPPHEARPARPAPDTGRAHLSSTRPGLPMAAVPVAVGSHATPTSAAPLTNPADPGAGNTGPSTPTPPARPNATDALRALGLPVPSRAATTIPASTDQVPAHTATSGSSPAREALSAIFPPAQDDGSADTATDTGALFADDGTTPTDTPASVPVSASDVLSGILPPVEDDTPIDVPGAQLGPTADEAGPSTPVSTVVAEPSPGIDPSARDDGPTNTTAAIGAAPVDDGTTPTDTSASDPVSASDRLSDLTPPVQDEDPADTTGGTNASAAGNGAAPGDSSPLAPIPAEDLTTGAGEPTQSDPATVTYAAQQDALPEMGQAPPPDPAQGTPTGISQPATTGSAGNPAPAASDATPDVTDTVPQDTTPVAASSPDTEFGGTTPSPTQLAAGASTELLPDATGPPPADSDVPVVIDSTPGDTGIGSAGDPAPTGPLPVATQGAANDSAVDGVAGYGAIDYETEPFFQPYDGPPPNPIPESAVPAPMAATDTSIDIRVSLDDLYIVPNPLAYLAAITDTATRASADEGDAVISAHFADAQASATIEPEALLVSGGAVDYSQRIATIELDHLTRAEALTDNPLGAWAKADTLVGFDGVIALPGADAALELEWDVDRLVVHSEATNALSVIHHFAHVSQRPLDGNAAQELVSMIGFSVLSQNGEQVITSHDLPGSTAMRDWLDRMNNGNAASQLLAGPAVRIPLTDQFIDSQSGLPAVEISLSVSQYEYAVESPASAVRRVAEQAGSVGNQGGARWNAATQILEFDAIPLNVLSDNAARAIADHYLHDPLVGAHLEIDPLVYAGALGDDKYFTGNEARLVGADGKVLFWASLPSVRFDDRLVGDQGFNLFSSLLNFTFEDGDGTTWLDQFGERFQQAGLYMPELFIGLGIPESAGDDWLSTTFESAVDVLLSFASSPAVSDGESHASEVPIAEPATPAVNRVALAQQALPYDPVVASNEPGNEWFSPGNSPGTAIIDGDYALDGGTLLFEILGTEAGLEYDQLIVNGNVDLNEGNVVFAFINDYVPQPSDLFELILGDLFTVSDSVNFYYGFFDPAVDPLWWLHAPKDLGMYTRWDTDSGIVMGVSGQPDGTGEWFTAQYDTSIDVAFYSDQGLQTGANQNTESLTIGARIPVPAPLLLIATGILLTATFCRKA